MKQAKTSFLKSLLNSLTKASIINQNPQINDSTFRQLENLDSQSRREFIATLGLGSLVALNACKSKNDKKHVDSTRLTTSVATSYKTKIAIIGGGISGLNCAYQLKKQGIDATIYEGSKRLGGRILTHYNDSLQNGVFPEFGGEFIDSNHEDMLNLAKEFQLDLIDFKAETGKLTENTYFFENTHYTEKDVIQEFKKVASKIQKDIDSLGEDYDTPDATKLDNTPLSNYVDELKCSTWLKELLKSAYVAEFGLDASEQSTLNFLDMVNTNTKKGFFIYGDSDERYRIKGGNSSLTKAISEKISKENIKLEHQLSAIEQVGKSYKLRFTNNTEVEAEYVVLTIPFTILRNISLKLSNISSEKKKCIDELGYGMNTKLMLSYEGRPWRDAPNNKLGYLFHKDITNGWDGSHNKKEDSIYGIYVCFFGGNFSKTLNDKSFISKYSPPTHTWKNQIPDENVNAFVDELDKVFKGSKAKFQNKHVFVNWIDYPFTHSSYSCYKVGQWSSISGKEIEPIDNIFFAGEHCSEDFQGYMNGGAETGRRVAENILKLVSKK